MSPAKDMSEDGSRTVSYAAFGEAFFEQAVTESRLLGAIAGLTGQPIDVGPIGVGPGRIAKVRAEGALGNVRAERVPDNFITFKLWIPVSLTFSVELPLETHRYTAQLEIPLVLAAQARRPLTVFIEITTPRAQDLTVVVRGEGLRAQVLSRVVGIESELRKFVAKYVEREVNKPRLLKARTIDVSAALDAAWASLAPREKNPPKVVDDLAQAVDEELQSRADEARANQGEVR